MLIAARAGGPRDPAPAKNGAAVLTALALTALAGLGYAGAAMSAWSTTWLLWLFGATAGLFGAVVDGTRSFMNRDRTRGGGSTTVLVRWRDGTKQFLGVTREVAQGARVTESRQPGALGFEWVEFREFL